MVKLSKVKHNWVTQKGGQMIRLDEPPTNILTKKISTKRFVIVVFLLVSAFVLSVVFGRVLMLKIQREHNPSFRAGLPIEFKTPIENLPPSNIAFKESGQQEIESCIYENSPSCLQLLSNVKDITKCERTSSKNDCLHKVAMGRLNMNICDDIDTFELKDRCYQDVYLAIGPVEEIPIEENEE